MCGSPLSLVPSQEKQTLNITIPSGSYACEYRIKAPDLKYRNSAKIMIWFEDNTQVRAYIYSGTNHKNITSLIEFDG